jgi:hypothetical protein
MQNGITALLAHRCNGDYDVASATAIGAMNGRISRELLPMTKAGTELTLQRIDLADRTIFEVVVKQPGDHIALHTEEKAKP